MVRPLRWVMESAVFPHENRGSGCSVQGTYDAGFALLALGLRLLPNQIKFLGLGRTDLDTVVGYTESSHRHCLRGSLCVQLDRTGVQ